MNNFIDRYLDAHRQLSFPLDCSLIPWLENQRKRLEEVKNQNLFQEEFQIYTEILDHESTKPFALYQMLLKGHQFFSGEAYDRGQLLVIEKLINHSDRAAVKKLILILSYYTSKNRLNTTNEVKKILLDYAVGQGWYNPIENTIDMSEFK